MKWWWVPAAAAVTLIVGVILGWLVNLDSSQSSGPRDPVIREVLLGTPATSPSPENPWQGSDRLTQKRNYTTSELLAVRVVSDEPTERLISFSVRLLQEDGSVLALSPSTFTVNGGTGGYCCWQVDRPGRYNLQIFREGQTPFVVPLSIVKAAQGNKSPLQR